MKRFIGQLVIMTLTTCLSAHGAVLFSHDVNAGGSTTGDGNIDYMTFPVVFSTQFEGSPLPQTEIFTNLQWTVGEVGTTKTITAGTDPDFNAFTSMLTDGVQEWIGFGLFSHPAFNEQSSSDNESVDVWGKSHPPSEIDLQGYQIDSYSMTLNSLSITNNPSTGTASYSADYTFTANGEPIPEPSCALLATAAGLILTRRRRQTTER